MSKVNSAVGKGASTVLEVFEKFSDLRTNAIILALIAFFMLDRFFDLLIHMVDVFISANVDATIWVGILIGAAITVGTGVIIAIVGVVNKLTDPPPGDPGVPSPVVESIMSHYRENLRTVIDNSEPCSCEPGSGTSTT